MAGYSKRSLVEKLGIKQQMMVTFINHPPGYEKTLGKLPAGTVIGLLSEGHFDFIQAFIKDSEELKTLFPILKNHIQMSGMIWISWPKTTAKTKTHINENMIREIGLQNGLVDVKVIAVDETWSGLKFVYRLKDRN